MDRAKAKRATVRQLFTKLVTKIGSTIELPINERFTEVNKVESLFDLKNQLIEKIDELKKLDNEIEAIIDLNDLEGELIASDEYRKNGISCRTEIERCILLLEKESNVIPRNETRNNNDSNIPEPLERRVVDENNVIKLPRLNISIFSGNCSEWLNFWNSFEVAIHKNDSLSKIEKFAYLKTYLRGTALAAVSGFALTDQNYDSSIALIKERFGRSDLVISCHMNKLLMIESVKSVSNVTALRKMYDELEIEVRSLESLGVAADNLKRNLSTAATLIATTEWQNCIFCSEIHKDYECLLSSSERKGVLINQGRCFVCLGRRHTAKICWKRNQLCRSCNKSHNSLICNSRTDKENCSNYLKSTETKSQTEISLLCREHKGKPKNSVCLQTFTAGVQTDGGETLFIRCLCDGGSSRTFIKREAADLLGLKVISREELLIYAFGNRIGKRQIYDVVQLSLRNRTDPSREIQISAVVIENITVGEIEVPPDWVRNIAFERGIELADTGDSEEVHVLIGSDFIWEVLKDTNVRLNARLVATDSIFGFVVQGSERESNCGEVHFNLLRVINEELKYDRVKDLSELEVIGLNPKKEIPHSDLEILEAFEQNVTYENNGYGTKLLWKDNHKGLNDNYEIARKRLFSLNKGFKRDENFYSKYKDINNSQLVDNIMLEINCESKNDVSKGFMPHRGVVKELKETNKLRICYDASSNANNEMSLNNRLDCCPNLNPDLLKIILKFVFYPIEFCADIQEKFLEVRIVEEERKFLQTLWGEDGGTNRTLDDHAVRILRTQRLPFLYKMTFSALNELYANDLIRSDYSLKETVLISKEAISILSEASVNMRQWTANSPSLSEMWRETDLECRQSSSDSDIPLKDLELIWDNKKDTLKVAFNLLQHLSDKIPTKGVALSACSVPCDPLDILIPFTVRIKLLIQKLWENDFTWDEPLPPDIEFMEWPHVLTCMQDVVVPHLHFSVMETELLEVDKSSGSSHKLYCSVDNFRMKHPNDVKTNFIVSKSRLNPLRTVTLPRLELLGSVALARLCVCLNKTFPLIKEGSISFWSDSQIYLHRVKSVSILWKHYIQNKENEIKE
ncbi:hypothetical protein AVEN_171650-1, partial [Araneus ventricosus]